TYKNTVTNGLFILVSSIMFMKTGTQSYLDDAAKTWAWLESSGMRQSNGLYADGIHTGACNMQTTLWSYNQGVVISGLAAYYSASTNSTLLDQAEITIDAMFSDSDISTNGILHESCDNPTSYGCGTDANSMVFKGLFMKHLQYYIDWANDATNARYAKYYNNIWAQYSAVFHYATNSDTESGTLWWQPDAGGSVFNGYSDQSGIDAILAAAKYGGCQST
ncbi:glycoside hydrolase, partial [Mycena sp. CBHHK59/15]